MIIEAPGELNWTLKILLKVRNTLKYSFYLTTQKSTDSQNAKLEKYSADPCL